MPGSLLTRHYGPAAVVADTGATIAPMAEPKDRRQDELRRLIMELRAELHSRADTPSEDFGQALVDLLAAVSDALSAHAERVAKEAYLPTAVRVEVDGEPWKRVESLDASGPDDPHYVMRPLGDGRTEIDFGDGERGRRPRAGTAVQVLYRRGGGRRLRSLLLQEGRVIIDEDWNAPAPMDVCGVHRGVVVDATDPMGQSRLLVQVPEILGAESRWALACVPATPGPAPVPSAGDGVWVAFEACDPDHPVWLGRVQS